VVEVVRGKVRRAGWTAVTPGAHVGSRAPELADRLRAWALVLPGAAAFTHLTAAELRGWWLPAPVPRPVFVTVARGDRHPQRRGLRVARTAATAAEQRAGLPVTTAAETLLACARDLDLLDLVPMADSALRSGDCDRDEVAELAAGRRPGARMLRRVLPLLDERSESAWESVMRVLHTAAGIEVVPQHVVRDERSGFVARADLWLVGTRRLHEYDGEVHRDPVVHRSDLDRDRRLVETGWQRCGYTSTEVLRRGGSIIASADAVLGRGWDPARLQLWRDLVRRSLYGAGGRAQARVRWRTDG
jgi:very-short-patch-repair endonuclease